LFTNLHSDSRARPVRKFVNPPIDLETARNTLFDELEEELAALLPVQIGMLEAAADYLSGLREQVRIGKEFDM